MTKDHGGMLFGQSFKSIPNFIPRRYLSSLILLCVIFLVTSSFYSFHSNRPFYHIKSSKSQLARAADARINNGTLGFEKVFVLGLEARSDKRDNIQLATKLTNINIEFMDGVNGDTIPDAAAPPGFFNEQQAELRSRPELGSWRGHINVIREIVAQNLGSALILEDDVDWDYNIVRQLGEFAAASRNLLTSLDEETGGDEVLKSMQTEAIGVQTKKGEHDVRMSPYGEDWDVLWLGHCGGWSPPFAARNYTQIIENDNTVPPSFDIQDLTQGLLAAPEEPCYAHEGRDPDQSLNCSSPRLRPDQRVVEVKGSPICSFAYALSQKGAQKALLHLGGPGIAEVNANFDTKLTEFCRGDRDKIGGKEMRCLTVSPPYFVHHRARGSAEGDSDLNPWQNENTENIPWRQIGITKGIVWSTRLNMANIIEDSALESQYTRENGKWRYKNVEEWRGGKSWRGEIEEYYHPS